MKNERSQDAGFISDLMKLAADLRRTEKAAPQMDDAEALKVLPAAVKGTVSFLLKAVEKKHMSPAEAVDVLLKTVDQAKAKLGCGTQKADSADAALMEEAVGRGDAAEIAALMANSVMEAALAARRSARQDGGGEAPADGVRPS